jgi:hypothetical protein
MAGPTVTYFPTVSTGGGGVNSTLSSELSTLYGLTGLTPATSAVDASDFTENIASGSLWTATGSPAALLTAKGGVWSANVAGASSLIRPTTAPNLGRATTAFGLSARMKFDNSSVAAGCLMRTALIDAVATTKGFFIGFYGTTFTGDGTKYVAATYDGTAAKYYTSTIVTDANWHVFRLWSADGATFLFGVDGETPITMNAGNLPASSVYLKAYLDANTAQNQSFDWFVAVSGRE